MSSLIPVLLLAVVSFTCHFLLGMFGIALGALGILSNLSITLAIDAYGPVSDNAGGLVEMCGFGEEVRARTDALDAAGNTTAAIGKGFAISSAAMVALSLYGAFITRASNATEMPVHVLNATDISVNAPLIFSGLLVGAVLPYAFSAVTMKAVGTAAYEMVKEIRK